jgi:hypothetical protein
VRGGVSQHHGVHPRPQFIRISKARSGTRMHIPRPLWASKPECDAHICLNLGFASQNFRFIQVSPHVCYFWSSPFRMDEGNTLPGEQGLAPFATGYRSFSLAAKPFRTRCAPGTRSYAVCCHRPARRLEVRSVERWCKSERQNQFESTASPERPPKRYWEVQNSHG